MNEKVNGVTLYAVNYKEADKILTVFTLEKGKITCNARGVRKANAKMKQIAEPFCFAEIMLAEKSGRYTVTEINSFDAFYPLRCDLKKYYVGTTALEFTNAFMPEEMVSEKHFVLLVEFLKSLAYAEGVNAKNLLVKFLYDLTNESGYSIDFNACGRCGEKIENRVFLSTNDGFCVCENCQKSGDKEFSFSTYEYLKRTANGDLSGVDQDADNGLKFFGYYINKVAGVNSKCISTLIELK